MVNIMDQKLQSSHILQVFYARCRSLDLCSYGASAPKRVRGAQFPQAPPCRGKEAAPVWHGLHLDQYSSASMIVRTRVVWRGRRGLPSRITGGVVSVDLPEKALAVVGEA